MIILKPNPGQQEFALRQPYSIKEILYGGSRGGGKTFAGLIWLTEYVNHPQFRGLVIRRNADDLSDWIERARFMYRGLNASITGNPTVIRFPSGALIRCGHLKDDSTYTKYMGHEYQKILIEELTQISTLSRYLNLISSCRTSIAELKPQVFATTNPGGVGHLWVKERFIDPNVPNKPFIGEDGLKRIFIPATIDDNPILTAADPEYVRKLEALQYTDEALYRAWRFGDWDIFVGQVYKEWRPALHVIDKLPVSLGDCERYIGFDWGYNDPASAHWIAAAPENEQGVKHFYLYREMYTNEKRAEWWAEQLADIVQHEPIQNVILPHDCFSHLGGNQTIASRFQDAGLPIISAEAKSHSAKINRQSMMHDLLSMSPDGKPYLQVLNTCRNLIRTLPALPYSDTKPEEIDEDSDDHCLAGNVLVNTDNGALPIESLVGTRGYLWSLGNLQPYHSVRKTGRERIYKLDFSDGTSLRCSSDHLILTNEGWVKAIDIRPYHLVQSYYVGEYTKPYNSGVQWGEVLSYRQILWAYKQTIQRLTSFTSSGLAIPQWAYSYGLPHTPQGFKPPQQSNIQSRIAIPSCSFGWPSCLCSGNSATEKTLSNSCNSESDLMAQVPCWSPMAQTTLLRITRQSEENVYNLEVDSTHCFSVEGGLTVHNCFDSATYGLYRITNGGQGIIVDAKMAEPNKLSSFEVKDGRAFIYKLDPVKLAKQREMRRY